MAGIDHHANFIIIFELYHYSSVLRCSLDWPGIYYVAHIGLKLIAILLSQPPNELSLLACTTLSGFPIIPLAAAMHIFTALWREGLGSLSGVQAFLHAHGVVASSSLRSQY